MPAKKKVEKKPAKAAATEETVDGDLPASADQLRKEGIITTFAMSNKTIHRNVRDINVTHLTVTFHGSPILEEAELTLNYGNRYGYIGRNGCGKSTFMRVIAARCFPIPEGIDIFHLREEIAATDMTAKEAVMSVDKERAILEAEAEELNEIMVAEEGTEEADQAMDRLNQIYERLEELDAATAEARASKILSGLGFSTEKQNKKTREFSGGWRMRIALARALFLQPTLLLLDEPTNHLDMEAVVWLEEYLSKWTKILFLVSHSQDFLNNVCTHIVHHHKKKLVYYSGNYDQFVKTRSEKEEEQEKRYKAEQDQIKHMKNYVAKFGQGNAKMAKQAQSKEKTLEKMLRGGLTEKVEAEKALDFKFPDPPALSPPVLQCNDITFGYPGCEILYRNVDFGVDLDSRVALVGPNGAGKSTLLKIMTGELQPVSGVVRPHAHLRIAKFTQHFVDVLDLSLSPLDYFLSLWTDMTREDGRKFLGRFGISGQVQTQVMGQLSDGQKSRVVLAKMAKEAPHVLFLDEPTNHLGKRSCGCSLSLSRACVLLKTVCAILPPLTLVCRLLCFADMESIDSLAKAINQFAGGVVLVSHDMRLISQVAKEIWLCDNRSVGKYVGEIADFKMQLRRQMRLDSSDGNAAVFNVVPLVSKKLSSYGDSTILEFAPPAPTVAPPAPPAAPAASTSATSQPSAAGAEGDDGQGEEGEEDKAAARARRKAEREAERALLRAREEEERIRKREEKLREAEEAKRAAEEEARRVQEWEAQKAERERRAQEEARAAAEAEAKLEADRLAAKRLKKQEREVRRQTVQRVRSQAFTKAVREDEWTQEQQEAFEEALLTYTSAMEKKERWTRIAESVGGGKSRQQCLARYRYLKALVKSRLQADDDEDDDDEEEEEGGGEEQETAGDEQA